MSEKNKEPLKENKDLTIVDKLKYNNNSTPIPVETPKEKEKIKEVIVYKERRGGGGCRVMCCGIFLILFLCCVSIIALIIYRPPFFWDRITDLLNNNLNLPAYETPKIQPQIEETLLQEITPGENIIRINENDLTFLARENLKQFNDLRFDIEQNLMRVYFASDTSERPVYIILDLVIDNNKIVLNRIGTSAIALPQGLYPVINDSANALINNLFDPSGESEQGGIENLLFNQSEGLTIKEIIFEKDNLVLNLNLDISLF